MDYSTLEALSVKLDDGLAIVTLRSVDDPKRSFQHHELTNIWRVFANDQNVKAVLITGAGDAEFYMSAAPPGGGPAGREGVTTEEIWDFGLYLEHEVADYVREMVRFEKPVVSAINGTASGAGLALAILADISIIAEDAWLCDPHVTLGVAAGDGPGALWSLFTGIAKAKLYLMTSDGLSGIEAERIGLVSRVVERDRLMETAMDYGRRFARGPEAALRFTKRIVNQQLRTAELGSQEYAIVLESLAMFSGERKKNPWYEWPPRIVP